MDRSPLACRWPIFLALIVFLGTPLFGGTRFTAAESGSPASAADAVRAALFDAQEITNPDLQRYLNRLSSLCFVLELLENKAAGHNTTLAKS